jgi:carbon storage regulator
MLILTRKIGEALVIDKDITVTVMGIKGTQIRIGVDAPRDIKVNREEIHNRIAKEQEQKD